MVVTQHSALPVVNGSPSSFHLLIMLPVPLFTFTLKDPMQPQCAVSVIVAGS